MKRLFLIVLFNAFSSLGFSSSLIGAAWPAIQIDLQLPSDWGGYISTLRTIAVIFSCYFLGKLIRSWGIRKLVIGAVFLLILSWILFMVSPTYSILLLAALPLGLASGALDAGINNFMAHQFPARILNGMHSFWGIGAVIGPIIMGQALPLRGSWRTGFAFIAAIQTLIFILLLLIRPLWCRFECSSREQRFDDTSPATTAPTLHPFKRHGMFWSICCFFLYAGIEIATAMWASSWLIQTHNFSSNQAATVSSIFFIGLMTARLLGWLIQHSLKDRTILYINISAMIIGGAVLLFSPYLGLACLGLGCGLVMPTMIHASPSRFGTSERNNPIGFQMAFAFIGGSVLAPLFGLVMQQWQTRCFPYLILGFAILLFICNEGLNQRLKRLSVS